MINSLLIKAIHIRTLENFLKTFQKNFRTLKFFFLNLSFQEKKFKLNSSFQNKNDHLFRD